MDETFDELHQYGKMEWTQTKTPHGYPVFVVYKTVELPGKPPERKGRVVIDIRGLNKNAEDDPYPMPLQTDITAACKGCNFISTVDVPSFFYGWPVAKKDRHYFTVVSHRGQETFKVPIMGFKGSPPYAQRQIDRILRPYRKFIRAYIDDMVVHSRTFEEHIQHLHTLFELFQRIHICLSPKKSYLGFPSVQLLGQRVDSLGLTTSTEKLDAILKLDFPRTLKDLETYISLTGWLREYVDKYAWKADALLRRKTLLLHGAPGGAKRKSYARNTLVADPTAEEKQAFQDIQDGFREALRLIHYDNARNLFADVDACYHGYGVQVYHVKGMGSEQVPPDFIVTKDMVEPIMFLSKTCTTAEKKLSATELEMAALVWLVKRIRHLIEGSPNTTVIFTDHKATPAICNQTKLATSNIDKLNPRLTRASQYLSQFRLDIRYKPGKQHVVPDALSRLPTVQPIPQVQPSHFGEHHAYAGSLVEMKPEVKARIMEGYKKDRGWEAVLKMLKAEAVKDKQLGTEDLPNGLSFQLRDGLIYTTANKSDGIPRLCLPPCFEKDMF